jgi:hypothetical protein
MGISDSAFNAFTMLSALYGLSITVFWVVVGWRAMRALEGMEESLRERNSR